ncbi:hypothetical protein BS50DRAFT_590371 [Corynespora cassiicola Philippines]|uniref:Thioredoxin domain-containing protein n=1 Tax=Corynespora cassiicola Philippines TaxID=1448308 RepID=A0A2T2NGM3_CORCC|nr:hypothetical protein BS50DRAFT_590371 [Corynespora cassiicola Philippines]
MSWQTELRSWMFPRAVVPAAPPDIGQPAPTSHVKTGDKPVVVAFLRHCGCPFAEKTFLDLRASAVAHPDIRHVAVSHSDQPSTDRWLASLPDPSNNQKVEMIVDPEREVYAAWGLGLSSFWHFLSPSSLHSVYTLGKEEGIWNRPTESGSRWQSSGSFAVDADGLVNWGRPNESADEIPNFEEAVEALDKV